MQNKYFKFMVLTILIIPILMILILGIYFNIKMLVSILVDNIEGNIKGILLAYVLVPALLFWTDGVRLSILFYYKQNKNLFKNIKYVWW